MVIDEIVQKLKSFGLCTGFWHLLIQQLMYHTYGFFF